MVLRPLQHILIEDVVLSCIWHKPIHSFERDAGSHILRQTLVIRNPSSRSSLTCPNHPNRALRFRQYASATEDIDLSFPISVEFVVGQPVRLMCVRNPSGVM
jgi:hypothetical protein